MCRCSEAQFIEFRHCAGGRIRVRLNVKELANPDRLADLELIIWGDNLHAPMIERIVELPMDVYGGDY
jgi:hypothetical protein